MKTKIQSHCDEVTNFADKKILNIKSNHACLAVINLNSGLQKAENDYLEVFLKEFKYIEKKVIRHVNSNLSDFAFSKESDEEQIRISYACI